MIQFHKRDKLNSWYIYPFRILEKIGLVPYWLKLSQDLERIHDVFHFSMLRRYISDMSHVLKAPPVDLKEDLSFKVQSVGIIDQKLKELQSKVIPMVKVL